VLKKLLHRNWDAPPTVPRQLFCYIDFLIVLTVVGLSFFLYLGSRPLAIPDEGRYAEIPREMLVLKDYITPHLNFLKYFEKPPLFYWLQTASFKLFGLNEWAARFPTALMGLLGCMMTYLTSFKLYGRRTAFLASIILASSMLYFAMAHLNTLDMTLSVFLTAALYCFILGQREPIGLKRRWLFWGMYLCASLAILTKGLIGLLFPIVIIGLWVLLMNQWDLLKKAYLPSGLLMIVCIALPWHLLVQRSSPEFFDFYIIQQQFLRYFTNSAGRSQAWWFFLTILAVGFFPWISFLFQAIKYHWPSSWANRHQQKEVVFLMLWAGLIFSFFNFSNSKLIPYILPVLPPLAILVAKYLAETSTLDKPPLGLKIGLGGIFICLGLVAITLTLLAIFPSYIELTHPADAQFYFIMSAILLSIGMMVMVLIKQTLPRLVLIALTSLCFYMITVINTPNIDPRSVKPLAVKLLPYLQPHDKIVTYEFYYQDLPFYLQRRLVIVNWDNELTLGKSFLSSEEKKQWTPTDEELWQAWRTQERIFLFTQKTTYINKLKQKNLPMYKIAETSQAILISNQAVDL